MNDSSHLGKRDHIGVELTESTNNPVNMAFDNLTAGSKVVDFSISENLSALLTGTFNI